MTSGASLHISLILDVSGSMRHDGKIQALNTAVSELGPSLERLSRSRTLTVTVIAFADEPRLHSEAVVTDAGFRCSALEFVPGGLTETSLAIDHAIERIEVVAADLAVAVLISDGRSTEIYGPPLASAVRQLHLRNEGTPIVARALGLGRDACVRELELFGGDQANVCEQPMQLAAAVRRAVSSSLREDDRR